MRWRIGSGFGIPVYIHWTFLLLPLWVIWVQPEDAIVGLSVTLTVVGLSFVCVVLHEFGHILMARRFGIGTEDVTLYPIGGVARLRKMTDKPVEELLIALAGPAVNVVIAAILFAILAPVAFYYAFVLQTNILSTFAGQVAGLLLLFNVVMVPFNLLPAFPMDGGRVLRAVLSAWLGHYQGTRIAVYVGVGMALLMAAFGIYERNLLPLIAIFVIFAGQQELFVAKYREHQRLRREEAPLEVYPVQAPESAIPIPQPPMLIFQPKISVYTWDNQTGTWRQEPGPAL